MSGREEPVAAAVLGHLATSEFIANFMRLFQTAMPGFLHEGKRYITIAFGCTGGRHRSVAVAEEVAKQMKSLGVEVHLQHRDVERG